VKPGSCATSRPRARGESLGAELDARTGDGRIVLDRPVTVTGTIKRSSVRGTLGSGGAPLRLRTGDGSIRLTGLATP